MSHGYENEHFHLTTINNELVEVYPVPSVYLRDSEKKDKVR